MPAYRDKNVTATAPTAVERVEMFMAAYGTYNEAITSHRDYEWPHGKVRTVTRTPLWTADLQELIRLAKIGQEAEDDWEARTDTDDDFYGPSAEEGRAPNLDNTRYL